MKKSVLFASIIAVASLSLLAACKQVVSTKPERRDITQAVYASGKVLPLNRYMVLARVPGYVDLIHVHTGDTVRAGDRLITIRNESNELSIASAGNSAALAGRNADENGPLLSAAREELAATRSKYEFDSNNYSRNKVLIAEDAISRSVFDLSRTQLDLSRSSYQKSLANFQTVKDRSRTEYLNALNFSKAQRSNRADYELTAALDGKVYDVLPQIGDLVGSQSPLIELGDANRFEVELSIDETDIGQVAVGQTVIYGIDAYPEQVFRGTITEIIPKITAASKSSRVKATISQERHSFYSGMSVEANIIVKEKKGCLVVPREFVKNGNQVKVKGEESTRTIRKGLEDLQYVEVIGGLDGSEELVK
jgi:HlyD family secretion protein